MVRTTLLGSLLIASVFAFMSCQSSNTQPQQCASCADAKTKSGWCDSCNVGYKPDGTTTKCKSCHTGITGQTVWCDGCKKGYINGKATKCQGCVAQAKGGSKCAT